MARNYQHYQHTAPSLSGIPNGTFGRMRVADAEGQFSHHGANWLADSEFGITLLRFGDIPYNNFAWTETKTNSSTITQTANGILFQTQAAPTNHDNVEIVSKRTVVPASSAMSGNTVITPQAYVASARFQVDNAAGMGFSFGFVSTGATGVVNTVPTDGIYFLSQSGSLIGQTVQNGNSPNDTATLLSVANATDMSLTVKFQLGTSASNSWGQWITNTGAPGANPAVVTPFTSAQVNDIFNMIAVGHALSAQLGFAVNGTTQHSGLVQWVMAECDR